MTNQVLRPNRLLIILGVLCIVFTMVVMSVAQASQTVISTPTYTDLELTVTQLVADVTQTSVAIGTPIPLEMRTATMQVAQATRTAIAFTREPYLLTPQLPNEIELTATFLMSNYLQTREAYTPPNITEIYATETFFVQQSTQTAFALTANPALALTDYPNNTPTSCDMQLYSYYPEQLSRKLMADLRTNAGIANDFIFVDIVTSGINNPCGELYPLETLYTITIGVSNLSDNLKLIDLIERILGLLQNLPARPSNGKVIRLQILFRSNLYLRKYINTGYTNALAAYAEGLRGDALIEALGGLLDWAD